MKKKQNPFKKSVDDEIDQMSTTVESEQIDTEGADEELQQTADALSAAEQELANHRDAMLRMQAEMENLRKRLTRDAEKSRRFALERIMKDLLQVVDTMERGLQTDTGSASTESLLEGQALTLKMMSKVLTDHHLELIDPAGEPFNPEFHEAVTMLPSPDHEDGMVMDVLQKGYKLHDRLIRPAMVVVSGTP